MSLLRSHVEARGIYQAVPPDAHTRLQDNPTFLMCWWCTGFSLVIILVRMAGRYNRTERFFTEDKVMVLSIIPLFIRMGFVHVALIWGTNNVKTDGLTELDIAHREIGSRMVLLARIFYAIYIWMAKWTVCEFLRRMTGMVWTRGFQVALRLIEYFLATTLLVVIIATLAECQPFPHNWQVVPDPGPRCRLAYANLLAMGVCDVLTDIFLVALPISLVLTSSMRVRRKIGLILLFALSCILIGITCYRVPSVITRNGIQSYRSLLASLEILAATAVSNAIVIGSFVRDRGVKKAKFKRGYGSASLSDSIDRNSVRRATITQHQWGSDADLVGDLGIRLDPELQATETSVARPAPIALSSAFVSGGKGVIDPHWTFPRSSMGTDEYTSVTESPSASRADPHEYIPDHTLDGNGADPLRPKVPPRKVSFFDVGGLLDSPAPTTPPTSSGPLRPALRQTHSLSSTPQLSTDVPPYTQYHQGSQTFLQDVGGLLSPSLSRSYELTPITPAQRRPGGQDEDTDPPAPPYIRRDFVVEDPFMHVELHDAGGLLSGNNPTNTAN